MREAAILSVAWRIDGMTAPWNSKSQGAKFIGVPLKKSSRSLVSLYLRESSSLTTTFITGGWRANEIHEVHSKIIFVRSLLDIFDDPASWQLQRPWVDLNRINLQGTPIHLQGTLIHLQGTLIHLQGTLSHLQGILIHLQMTFSEPPLGNQL